MATLAPPVRPAGPATAAALLGRVRRSRPPALLVGASVAIAIVLAMPLVFLLIEAGSAGLSTIGGLIFRSLTATLLWNTIRLTISVTVLCAVIGTAVAWLIERTDLPGRRVFAVLVVVPLAIPDFVVSFGWSSISTWVEGFRGAVLVMTLAVYPLVYLPVAASFRNADPGQEEVARSFGYGRARTFWRVTLRQARGAILGGCLLVVLVLLAEYGGFEILGYQTFTTEIFTEFNVSFNVPTACALSLVLVLLSILALGGEAGTQRGRRISRKGPLAQRPAVPHRLGRWRWLALALLIALLGLALGVPVGSAIYWIIEQPHATKRALTGCLERSTYLVLAIPGLVIALALSYFAERYADGFMYQSAPLLVLAYAILFVPLALVGVRASVLQAPPELEEIARSLGSGRLAALARVTLPLIGPGLAAAFCLVFLSAVTELTATLILVPTGVQTLATQFWAYQQNLAYGQAAPYALAIIAIAAVPSIVLGRFFDRAASRTLPAT